MPFGSEAWLTALRPLVNDAVDGAVDGAQTVVLEPGPAPSLANENQAPELRAFVDAYSAAYGEPPSAYAAWGYRVARRIDAAVRALGGVADKPALQRQLQESEGTFMW